MNDIRLAMFPGEKEAGLGELGSLWVALALCSLLFAIVVFIL